jgi:hypothetical protein
VENIAERYKERGRGEMRGWCSEIIPPNLSAPYIAQKTPYLYQIRD